MQDPSRASFLRRLAALVVGTSIAGLGCREDKAKRTAPASTKAAIRWRMVTTWPPGFPVLGEGCQLMADWVREMSGGELDIQVYGAGELIPGMEVFDAVSSGTAQMGSGAAYYWAGKLPAAQYFGAVPFGMNAQQLNAWLYAGGGLQLWEELYAPFDLLPMPGGNTGVQMGGWFNREIRTIEDLKGLKMRIPGLGGKVLSKAGGTAVLSSGNEIYTNLERGVIDATEWIGPYHDYRMGFHEITRYYYYPGWHEPGSVLELLFHRPTFEAMPGHLQAILRAAAARMHGWIIATFDARNGEYLRRLRELKNLEIRPFPEEVLDILREKTLEVLEELRDTDPLALKVHDAYFRFFEEVKTWTDISEREMYRIQF
jgi:TRAP-type mannitol/chloroaromatic compound transport system substrate-binding protein